MRVLGRVERYRDRLQLDVRSIEPAPDTDPAGFAPAMRRDPDELDGFLDFLAGEIAHAGPEGDRAAHPRRRRRSAGGCARSPPRPTATTTTRAACSSTRSASRRSAASSASCIPACAPTCSSRPRSCTTSGGRSSSSPGPGSGRRSEGRLLGHVHLGARLIEERAGALDEAARAELLHAVTCAPRRPRREDGRGGRPVPREPAGRGRRDAAGRELLARLGRDPARARRERVVGSLRLPRRARRAGASRSRP